MDLQARIEDLVARTKAMVSDVAREAAAHDGWSMNLPVCVIDDRGVIPRVSTTAVGTIGSVVRTSTVIDNPLIQEFLDLCPDRGTEAALDVMLNNRDEAKAEQFAFVYDAYREERKSGALIWGANDAAAFVMKSQDCVRDNELACVALLPAENAQTQVCTFSLPIAFIKGAGA